MKENNGFFDKLLEKVEGIVNSKGNDEEKLKEICELLQRKVSHYNWVGFYLVDPSKDKELTLGPFAGEPTEHLRIPFGKGVCGQAAEKKKTIVVQDVSKEKNYLACSLKVKSEIVVPIFKNNKLVGEIDIDSHQLSSFKKEDEVFLEKVSKLVANILKEKKG
ncbi:MAG TPA: GAF domain-containing protein [Thermoplasmatales archaeon]|nr:GAF domain-containing protein [Thermoplasmatales archaeon]